MVNLKKVLFTEITEKLGKAQHTRCKYRYLDFVVIFHTDMETKMFTTAWKREDLATLLNNGQCEGEMSIASTNIPKKRDAKPYSKTWKQNMVVCNQIMTVLSAPVS